MISPGGASLKVVSAKAWTSGSAALLSVLIDARCGEPPARLHPVVWMGQYLGLYKKLRGSSRSYQPYQEVLAGAGFVLVGASVCGAAAWGAQRSLRRLPRPAEVLGTAALLKPLFSIAALLAAGGAVRDALVAHDLTEARRLLAWHLVSRDTLNLTAGEVAGAAISSLAENLTDSIVAPLFYFALFGLPGAAIYRFVNTADAVLGYRTPELEYFGKVAACTDDALNFVPARLAATLLFFALQSGLPARKNRGAMLRGVLRDSRRTPSPNGGLTMALTAGGLGVELAKRGVYTLNETGQQPTAATIDSARHLIKLTTVLGFGLYAFALGSRSLKRA